MEIVRNVEKKGGVITDKRELETEGKIDRNAGMITSSIGRIGRKTGLNAGKAARKIVKRELETEGKIGGSAGMAV